MTAPAPPPDRARWIGVLALALLLPSGTPAQTLVGRVVDQASREPLEGAFVFLEDSAGVRHEGVLSRPDGRFTLRARMPGRYRAVAELIGYASIRTDFFRLPPGETVVRNLEAPVQAISLEGISVDGESRCRARPGSSGGTERLWEEARKALEMARWSESAGVLRFRIVEHRRELDAATLRVTAERERPRVGLMERSPYRSIPAADLEARGYIQESASGGRDYYAPDADVLLSDSFLDSHCFRVVAPPDDESELIGLAFEPVPGRDLPEIEGTLWLERGTGELRRLDYRYVHVPSPFPDWPEIGGRVEFERLSTGAWFIPRWHIRMPLQAERIRSADGSPGRLSLETISETGARVTAVQTAAGEVLAEAAGATLYGTVTDAAGEPVAGVEVRLPVAGRLARTGPGGAYRFRGLSQGSYEVLVRHPALALLGAAGEERTVTLRGGRALRLPVELPPEPEIAREACRGSAGGGAGRPAPLLLHGVARGPGGETAVPGALVRVEREGAEHRTSADSLGVYHLCLDPADAPLRVGAALRGSGLEELALASLGPVEVDGREAGLVRADPALPPSAVSGREGAEGAGVERWASSVVGTVVAEGTGRPVASAVVGLVDGEGDVVRSGLTAGDGGFRLLHPDGRTTEWTLTVEHPDYGRAERALEMDPSREVEVEVLLVPRTSGESGG